MPLNEADHETSHQSTFSSVLHCCPPRCSSTVCATTDILQRPPQQRVAQSAVASHVPVKYKADDGRTIEIGRSTADTRIELKEPHLDKCWIADGLISRL